MATLQRARSETSGWPLCSASGGSGWMATPFFSSLRSAIGELDGYDRSGFRAKRKYQHKVGPNLQMQTMTYIQIKWANTHPYDNPQVRSRSDVVCFSFRGCFRCCVVIVVVVVVVDVVVVVVVVDVVLLLLLLWWLLLSM